MNAAEFVASLPPALTRHGAETPTGYVQGSSPGEIVIRIRQEIALAVALGVLPAGTKVSVRQPHYKSIIVSVTAWSGAVLCDAYVETLMDETVAWRPERRERDEFGMVSGDDRYTAALNSALSLIEKIADRHNYNNSDYMTDYFDVGYYLSVDARPVAGLAERAIREEADPDAAALRAKAIEAAKTLPAKAVKSICGRLGVTGTDEWSLKHLIKLAEHAKGRPVAYDKSTRGWRVIEGAS